jgi:ABC-type branched-subunit amino acid transport system substrate-binding protein
MEKLRALVSRLQTGANLQLVMGLGLAIVTLLLISVIGYYAVGDDSENVASQDSTGLTAGEETTDTTLATTDPSLLPTETTAPGATAPGAAQRTPSKRASGGGGGGGTGIAAADLPSTQGATRIGVTPSEIRWGLHAPETFDGAPLNLAEDPLKGVDIYLSVVNEAKIHGRTVKKFFADDRYTVQGGNTAGKKLINDDKVFFVSGTLGVDQVAQVAAQAKEQKVPYTAAGGSEEPFKDIGMFQISASYDTHLIKLAQYLGKEKARQGSPYFNKTKVGVSRLDSAYIQPSVEKVFKAELEKNGLQLVKTVTVDKPTQQRTYGVQIQQLISAGSQILVPAQDPITTSRMTAECQVQPQCAPLRWTISNFAHESDVALTLMRGSWTGVRGLSGGCYYTSTSPNCGALSKARDEWIKKNGQSDFNKDGQGGVAGYQVVHFWLKALKDIGPDPTREKLFAAFNSYEGYNDLVSGPITHKNSPNKSHGAELMVIFEATNQAGPQGSGNNFTWKQISDGFVSGF